MAKNKRSRNIDRWVKRHQNKHLCGCGCGEYIEVKREHAKPSVGIPKFIKGHNLKVEEQSQPVVQDTESLWDRLSPEEQERRLSQLKNFQTGENNPAWKGGRRSDENGYILILMPEHPFARDGYMAEHRLVVEERTRDEDPNNPLLVEVAGEKYLRSTAVVHHIDEVKHNNDSSNLMLLPKQSYHGFIHYSPLPMNERLIRIAHGICHSNELNEQELEAPLKFPWILDYIDE